MRSARVAVVLFGLLTSGCSESRDSDDAGGAGGSGATGLGGGASGVAATTTGAGGGGDWGRVAGVEASGGASSGEESCVPVDATGEVSTTLRTPDFGVAQYAIAKLRSGQLPNPVELSTTPFFEYFRPLVPTSAEATKTSVTAEYRFLESSTQTVGRVDLTVRAPALLTPRKDGHFVFAVALTPGMPRRGPLVQELVARGVAALVGRGFVGYFSVLVMGAETIEVIPPTPVEAGLPVDLATRLDAKLAVDALSGLPPADSAVSSLLTLWSTVKDLEATALFVPAYREYALFVAGDVELVDELATEIGNQRASSALDEKDMRLHAVQVAASPDSMMDDPLSKHRPDLTAQLSRAGDGYGLYADDALLDTSTVADFALTQSEFALFVPALRGVRLSLFAPPNAWFDVSDSPVGDEGSGALAGALEAGATVRRAVPMGACSSEVTGGEGALETTDPTEGSVYDAVVSFDAAEPVEQAREEAIASVVFALRGTQADFCTRFSLAQSLIEGYELLSSADSATPCAALPAALDACSGVAPVDSAAAACCLGARLRGVLESADALVPLPCTP